MNSWFIKEEHGNNLLRLCVIVLIFNSLWPIIYALTLYKLFGSDDSNVGNFVDEAHQGVGVLIFSVVESAFIEELIFRTSFVILGYYSLHYVRFLRQSNHAHVYFFLALISSTLFGIVHGGYQNICVQGVHGFTMFLIFLKSGGPQNRLVKATFVTTAYHAWFNLSVTVGKIIHSF